VELIIVTEESDGLPCCRWIQAKTKCRGRDGISAGRGTLCRYLNTSFWQQNIALHCGVFCLGLCTSLCVFQFTAEFFFSFNDAVLEFRIL